MRKLLAALAALALALALAGAARPDTRRGDVWDALGRCEAPAGWHTNTGNGYYGGLQMDLAFQRAYGADYLRRWGTADRWPAWAQKEAARRARDSGRGYAPWPACSRRLGLR